VFLLVRHRPATALVVAFILVPALAAAHPGHTQNPALLAAVVNLGGGADHFSAATFRHAVAAVERDEETLLRSSVGSAAIDRFDTVFTYVVNDGLATMKRSGKMLPAPSSTDAKIVAASLFQAGLHDGSFDVEQLFDTLFSAEVHDHAMVAVGRKYGADGETAYHTVIAKLIADIGKP